MQFDEVVYGDCSHCNYNEIQFRSMWSDLVASSGGTARLWTANACPRCGGVTLIELQSLSNNVDLRYGIPGDLRIAIIARYPAGKSDLVRIEHLPSSVARYFSNAHRVRAAGVNSAAAVELRRTLESAVGQFEEVTNQVPPLVKRIETLIERGLVTSEFGNALTHVRRIGNAGAHAGEDELSNRDIDAAFRFTEQLLRNLFEVPGELAAIQEAESAEDN